MRRYEQFGAAGKGEEVAGGDLDAVLRSLNFIQ